MTPSGVPEAQGRLRAAWEDGIKTAVAYTDNVGHLIRNTGGQADRHFQAFLDSLRSALPSAAQASLDEPDVQLLAWAVSNCHMLARRALAKTTSVYDREKWEHVLRICEKAGARSKGVLRASLPTELTEGAAAQAPPHEEAPKSDDAKEIEIARFYWPKDSMPDDEPAEWMKSAVRDAFDSGRAHQRAAQKATRDVLLATITRLLESAHPSAREHPTMFSAWQAAKEVLAIHSPDAPAALGDRASSPPPEPLLVTYARLILDTFTKDEAAGYCSHDRQFVIELLRKAFAASPPLAEGWQAIETYRENPEQPEAVVVWNGRPWLGYYEEHDGWFADVDGELLRIDPPPTLWLPAPPLVGPSGGEDPTMTKI